MGNGIWGDGRGQRAWDSFRKRGNALARVLFGAAFWQ